MARQHHPLTDKRLKRRFDAKVAAYQCSYVDGRDGFLREQAGIVDQETVRNAASAVLKSLLQVLQPHTHQIEQVSRESVGLSRLVREVETVFLPCTVEERYRTVSKQVQELVSDLRNKINGNDKFEELLDEIMRDTEKLKKIGAARPKKGE